MSESSRCWWCNPNGNPIAPHEGPHATWCPHFREEQRGGLKPLQTSCPSCQNKAVRVEEYGEECSAGMLIGHVRANCVKCGHWLTEDEIYDGITDNPA